MHEAVGCSLLLGTMPAMERAPGLPGSPWQGLAAAAHSRTPGPVVLAIHVVTSTVHD